MEIGKKIIGSARRKRKKRSKKAKLGPLFRISQWKNVEIGPNKLNLERPKILIHTSEFNFE